MQSRSGPRDLACQALSWFVVHDAICPNDMTSWDMKGDFGIEAHMGPSSNIWTRFEALDRREIVDDIAILGRFNVRRGKVLAAFRSEDLNCVPADTQIMSKTLAAR
jgi:hypothetical protein